MGTDRLLGIVEILQILSERNIGHVGERVAELLKIKTSVFVHHGEDNIAPAVNIFSHCFHLHHIFQYVNNYRVKTFKSQPSKAHSGRNRVDG